MSHGSITFNSTQVNVENFLEGRLANVLSGVTSDDGSLAETINSTGYSPMQLHYV